MGNPWDDPAGSGGGGGGGGSNPWDSIGSHPAVPTFGANRFAGLNPQHGNIFGNLFGQAGSLIGNIPNAVVGVTGAGWHDLHLGYKTVGAPGWSPSGNLHELEAELGFGKSHIRVVPDKSVPADERGFGGLLSSDYWHDPRTIGGGVLRPQYEVAKQDVGAARHGDWHYFEQHPLNPIIDIATVASLGGVGALKLAAAGKLGEGAATLANSERLLRSGEMEEALNQARTLQGRIRQRVYDNWRMKPENADFPVIGANVAIKRILTRRAAHDTVRMLMPVRAFQRITQKLTPAEAVAVHIIAEPVTLTDRINYYKAREVEIEASLEKRAKRLTRRPPKTRARIPKGLRNIREYLAMIEDPAVREAVENPSQNLVDAVWAAYDHEKAAGRTLMNAGVLTQEARDKRVQLPADEMTPPVPPPSAAGAAPATPPPGPMHGPTTAPPWIGAPTRPPSVFPGGPPTFVVRVQRSFFHEYMQKAELPEGASITPHKARGNTIPVRVNEAALRHIIAAAKKDNKSSARATILKIQGQMEKHVDAVKAKAGRKLPWKRDAQTGSSYVPGSDYHVDPIHETGEWQAMKGHEGLGVYEELHIAKDVLERHAERLRNEELRAERAAVEATHAPGIGAESFTEGATAPVARTARAAEPVATQTPRQAELEAQITDLDSKIAAAERRLALTKDADESAKLHSLIEKGRAKQMQMIEEWMKGQEESAPRVEEPGLPVDQAAEASVSVSEAEAPTSFHGTRQRFEGDQPGDIYSTGSGANNLYGHGFYTTDSRDVASTYTHKGGATESQHVYGVHWHGEGKPKLLDLDKPAHATVKEWAQAQLTEADAGHFDVSVESYDELEKAMKSGSSGEVIRAVRRMWGSTGEIPKTEVDDMVSGLSDLLSAKGFDGLKHVGGTLRGGGKRHNVSIFFDPKKLKLSDARNSEELGGTPEELAPPAEAPEAASVSEPPRAEAPAVTPADAQMALEAVNEWDRPHGQADQAEPSVSVSEDAASASASVPKKGEKATPKSGHGLYSFTRRSSGKTEHEFEARSYADAKKQYREATNTRSVSQRYMDIRVRPLEKTDKPMETSHIPALDGLRMDARAALEEYVPTGELDQQHVESAWEKLKSPTARLTDDEQRVVKEALDQKAMYDAKDGLPPMSGGSLGYLRNVHGDAFPPNFRFPHMREGVGAGDFIPRGVERALGHIPLPRQLRRNEAYLLRNALMLTDPEMVYTRDYLSTQRWASLVNLQRHSLVPISTELELADAATGFKKPREWYFRPSFDLKATAPIPRDVKFAESLNADRMALDTGEVRRGLEGAKNKIVDEHSYEKLMSPEELSAFHRERARLTPDERDAYILETMNKLGIRKVPATFGKDFSKEFGGTNAAVRIMIDRPLDAWRVITLNYRPAWAVNNLVGNALMGFSRYGTAGAAAYLRVLLATERGPDKVLKLWKFTKKVPTLQRKYGEAFREVAPWLHSAGLYGSQSRITHMGIYSGYGEEWVNAVKASKLRYAGMTVKGATAPVRAVGRGIVRMEILLAEDTGREAAFLREAGADIARIKESARKAGEANLSTIEALKRMDQKSIELATERVNDFLGDFNDLNGTERHFLRRFIPFYSWFKVITKVTAKFAARYPARVLLLKNIEDARSTKGEPQLPSWLGGSVLVGSPNKQGVQTLISTQGLNPYQSIPQVARGGLGGIQNPFVTAAVIAESGRDPAFGSLQDYFGPGATNKSGWEGQGERVLGAFFGGLGPVRLQEQTTNPYHGKLYAPRTYAQAGPLSVNDFLLQYLGIPIRHVNTAEARRERGLR